MKIKNLKLKNYINEFNFPNPDWDNLPRGFFKSDTSTLTTEEKHLFDSIQTAWVVAHPYPYFISKFTYATLTISLSSFVLTGLTMFIYYVNIRFHLGLTFLTEFFA